MVSFLEVIGRSRKAASSMAFSVSAPKPPRLAANLAGSPLIISLTFASSAVEPVKKVLIPKAANAPLLSPLKQNTRSFESLTIDSSLVGNTLAEIPSTLSNAVARSSKVMSAPMPSRSTMMSVVCVCSVFLLWTII